MHDEHLKSSEIPPDPITKDFRRYIKVGNRTIIDNDNDGYFPEYDSDREVEAEYGKTDPADNNPTPDPTLYW